MSLLTIAGSHVLKIICNPDLHSCPDYFRTCKAFSTTYTSLFDVHGYPLMERNYCLMRSEAFRYAVLISPPYTSKPIFAARDISNWNKDILGMDQMSRENHSWPLIKSEGHNASFKSVITKISVMTPFALNAVISSNSSPRTNSFHFDFAFRDDFEEW